VPVVLLIVFIAWARSLKDRWVGPRRDYFDRKRWPFTAWRAIQEERFLIAWAALFETRILSEIKIMERISEYGGVWLSSKVAPALPKLRAGKSFGVSVAGIEGFLDDDVVDSIQPKNMRLLSQRLRMQRGLRDDKFYKFLGMGVLMSVISINLLIMIGVFSQLDMGQILRAIQDLRQ
jgi:hypothetical protein